MFDGLTRATALANRCIKVDDCWNPGLKLHRTSHFVQLRARAHRVHASLAPKRSACAAAHSRLRRFMSRIVAFSAVAYDTHASSGTIRYAAVWLTG